VRGKWTFTDPDGVYEFWPVRIPKVGQGEFRDYLIDWPLARAAVRNRVHRMGLASQAPPLDWL
jgi:hypothetical protein